VIRRQFDESVDPTAHIGARSYASASFFRAGYKIAKMMGVNSESTNTHFASSGQKGMRDHSCIFDVNDILQAL
jgi:hypothetical protein